MTTKQRPYVEGDEPVPGYRLTAYLGEGGFGAVWRATAPGGAPAALKIVDLGTRQGQKEFRALAVIKRLQHPNLVPISAYWLKDADGQFLDPADMEQVAMQGVQSTVGNSTQQTIAVPRFRPPLELFIAMGLGQKSLGQRLAECREQGLDGIPPAELLRYMDDVASALDHLGNPSGQIGAALDGVQHGDIKPQNILIVSGRAQVCDFGLARVLTDTRRTSLSGSPAYMAPETQKNVLSPAVDQYSLAITYFELRTGRLPFADDLSLLEMWNVHLNGTLDLSALAPAEREVIARATALDPAMRFATSGEMVDALRKAVAGESAPAPQSVVVPVPHTPSKLRPVLMLAAMFGFAAVAVMGWFHSSSQLAPIRPVHGLALHVKPVVLKAGENGLAQVQVRRGDCNGPIRLTWRDLPEGVVPQGELVVPAADVAADITLSVDAKVPETTTKVYMSATAPGVDTIEAEVELRIVPADVWLPADKPFRVAVGADYARINGRYYAATIEYAAHGVVVPFRLIEHQAADDPSPFYIMQDKLANEVFAAFAAQMPDATENWRQSRLESGKKLDEGSKLPVMNVTWDEALACAAWLGGRLPTLDQWDKAAGRRETGRAPREGPYRGMWHADHPLDIAVGLKAPREIGAAQDDVSPFGCRDMSGNGLEWTRSCRDDYADLRGGNYLLKEPFTFKLLDEFETPSSRPCTQAFPYVGFRVVIDDF